MPVAGQHRFAVATRVRALRSAEAAACPVRSATSPTGRARPCLSSIADEKLMVSLYPGREAEYGSEECMRARRGLLGFGPWGLTEPGVPLQVLMRERNGQSGGPCPARAARVPTPGFRLWGSALFSWGSCLGDGPAAQAENADGVSREHAALAHLRRTRLGAWPPAEISVGRRPYEQVWRKRSGSPPDRANPPVGR
jgi:hypothetical protein